MTQRNSDSAKLLHERPDGRLLAFAPDDIRLALLSIRICPITGQHLLLPSSLSRIVISAPYGDTCLLRGGYTGLLRFVAVTEWFRSVLYTGRFSVHATPSADLCGLPACLLA